MRSKKELPPIERYKSAFPDRLRTLMRENGVTQQELANSIDKSRPVVGSYANGIANPDLDTLVKIARYFGVSTDYLLGESEYTKPDMAEITVEDIGLSETAVAVLQQYRQLGTSKVIETINALLENDPFDEQNILRCISAYLFFEKDIERDYRIINGGLIIEKNVCADEDSENDMTNFEKDILMSILVPYLYTLTDSILFEEALFNLASTSLRKLKESIKKRREEEG